MGSNGIDSGDDEGGGEMIAKTWDLGMFVERASEERVLGAAAEVSDGALFENGGGGNVTETEGIAGDRQPRQMGLDSIGGKSQALDAAQVTDGNAADNEDGGEQGGIIAVLGTNVAAMGILMGSSTTIIGQNVGSGIVHTEIETRPALGYRQGRPKPENWKVMTKTQRTHWYKRKSGEDGWSTRVT